MADNTSEIPESPDSVAPFKPDPNKSIWDTFGEGRIEKPRDISAEVEAETQKDSLDIKEPETQEEAVIRLAKEFDAQLMKYRTELITTEGKKVGLDAQEINERLNKELNSLYGHYIYLRGEKDSFCLNHSKFKTVEDLRTGEYRSEKLNPESEVVALTESGVVDPNNIQNIKTHIGIVPAMFVGSDGLVYQAGSGYSLNLTTGEIKKGGAIEQIQQVDPEMIDIDSLKRVPYQRDYGTLDYYRREDFEDTIEPEDFERLEEILSRMESGELKLDADQNFVQF